MSVDPVEVAAGIESKRSSPSCAKSTSSEELELKQAKAHLATCLANEARAKLELLEARSARASSAAMSVTSENAYDRSLEELWGNTTNHYYTKIFHYYPIC